MTSRAIPKASTNSGTPVVSGQPTDGAQRGTKSSSAQPPGPKPPLVPPAAIAPGSLVREWRVSGSSLDRALGRPLRDQVYSTRDTQATTIQALELVNGERLNHWLWRGARRMLGELPPEPQSLLAWQLNEDRSQPTFFDLDISKSDKLFLIVDDALSTAADKGFPLWEGAEVVGPSGAVPLSNLTPLDRTGIRDDSSAKSGVPVKMNSVVVYDIAGKGFTRFRGTLTFEPAKLEQGENVMARFYVFDRQPTLDRLTPPKPEAPLAVPPPARTVAEAVDRVYWHALGRAPNDAERQVAETALRSGSGKPSADGLADLLWAVLMTPEFQLIR